MSNYVMKCFDEKGSLKFSIVCPVSELLDTLKQLEDEFPSVKAYRLSDD